MSTRLSLLALGIGVYLAVAVVSFPAALAYRWFAPDELALAAVEGTIWQGRAAHGGVNGLAFSNLAWRLRPAALLTGRLSLTAETDIATGFARADIVAAGRRLELTNVSASTDLASFRGVLPLGGVAGQVSLALERLELVDGFPAAAVGEARVGDLSVPPLIPMRGVTTIALGNYVARFTPAGEPGVQALISDQGGPLELTGRISLGSDRAYVLDTLIRPRADADRVLVDGLEMVTEPPNAEGQRRFRLTGTL